MKNRTAAKSNVLIRILRGSAFLRLAATIFFIATLIGLSPEQHTAANAQGFGWPWETEEPRREPVPSEPVWREPEPRRPSPQQGDSWNPDRPRSTGRSSVCLSLEQRLVKENQNAGSQRERHRGRASVALRLKPPRENEGEDDRDGPDDVELLFD